MKKQDERFKDWQRKNDPDHALALFEREKDKDEDEVKKEFCAMIAIRKFAEAGRPIPPALLPYFRKAMDAWDNTKGNIQRRKSANTEQQRNSAIIWMTLLIRSGKDKNDAARIVHREYPHLSKNTLLEYYRKQSGMK